MILMPGMKADRLEGSCEIQYSDELVNNDPEKTIVWVKFLPRAPSKSLSLGMSLIF